jgi:hypothetical protein
MFPNKRLPTARQALGVFGEKCVTKDCRCPRCKRSGALVRLPPNFKCADVICDFCGYLAQVKAATVEIIDKVPGTVLGAAWGPQKERMDAAIYFPLYLVLVNRNKDYSIFYLSADLQDPRMFQPRAPLSALPDGPGGKASPTSWSQSATVLFVYDDHAFSHRPHSLVGSISVGRSFSRSRACCMGGRITASVSSMCLAPL